MLIAVSVFVAHVSAARLDIQAAEVSDAPMASGGMEPTRTWLIARLGADPGVKTRLETPNDAPLARLRAAAIDMADAVEAYLIASRPE